MNSQLNVGRLYARRLGAVAVTAMLGLVALAMPAYAVQAYPTFRDVTYQGLPGYEAGDAYYPYSHAHYEHYFGGSVWVAGAESSDAESSDDTQFRGAPPIAHAVVDELVAYQGQQTATPSITPTGIPTGIPTGSPTVCPSLSGTGGGICTPGYLGIYSYNFDITNDQAQSTMGIVEVHLQISSPWHDWDTSGPYQYVFQPGTNHITGSFYEFGPPPGYLTWRVLLHGIALDNCWTLDVYTPQYSVCTEATPVITPASSATATATPTISPTPALPTAHPPDLTGRITWLPSCNIAHGVSLRTELSGDPNVLPAGPSHMRLENRAGDHINFPVPSLGGPNPPYYDYTCSAGSCIPQSWQDTLPYTLTVDVFSEVAETNEWNNVSVLGGPTPTPAPCMDTPTPTSTLTPGTGTPTITASPTRCRIEFTDAPPGSNFYPYIHCLACRGIVSGYTNGTFRPGNNVTRGQMAKMVAGAAGLRMPPYPTPCPTGTPCPVPTPVGQQFADVWYGTQFFEYIYPLADRHIVTGYPCGGPGEPCDQWRLPYFRPNSGSTRGQLAKVDAKAAGYNDQPTGQTFADIPPDHSFYLWIERLAERGIVGGYPCGGPGEPCDEQSRPYFRPGNNVTRGQAAKIVANTFLPNCQTLARR